jgi:hypothetical protein
MKRFCLCDDHNQEALLSKGMTQTLFFIFYNFFLHFADNANPMYSGNHNWDNIRKLRNICNYLKMHYSTEHVNVDKVIVIFMGQGSLCINVYPEKALDISRKNS